MAKRVLLADDDSDDRDFFITFFSEREDIILLPFVGNGLELVDFLTNAADDELPELIIIDQNMPRMNGKQTLEYLRSNKRFSSIPAVIYSTYADNNLIMDCKNLGAKMVAVKPTNNRGYQKMMDEFLLFT